MTNTKDDMRVLAVSSSDKAFEVFRELISDEFTSELTRAVSVGEAKRLLLTYTYDIIIINSPLRDETGIDFSIDAVQESSAGVMILISSDYYEQVSDEVGQYGVLTVSKPTNRQILYESVRLLAATNARLRKVENKNAKLTAKMEEIRVVNHAKWKLIENLNISEEAAHRLIEKQAMDTRISKLEVAEMILKTYK